VREAVAERVVQLLRDEFAQIPLAVLHPLLTVAVLLLVLLRAETLYRVSSRIARLLLTPRFSSFTLEKTAKSFKRHIGAFEQRGIERGGAVRGQAFDERTRIATSFPLPWETS
jgi:hypothetical protein